MNIVRFHRVAIRFLNSLPANCLHEFFTVFRGQSLFILQIQLQLPCNISVLHINTKHRTPNLVL